jgi:hypothetical protein
MEHDQPTPSQFDEMVGTLMDCEDMPRHEAERRAAELLQLPDTGALEV